MGSLDFRAQQLDPWGQFPSLELGGLHPQGHHVLLGMTGLDLSLPPPWSPVTRDARSSGPDPCLCHRLLPSSVPMSFALEVRPLFDGCWG